jgi:leucyl-tRNA synthetase
MPREIITATVLSEDTTATPTTTEESTLSEDQNLDGDLNDLISSLDEGETEESPTGGFGLSFTPDKEYDLDAIIESISRDNDEYALIMRVNTESEIVQAIIDRCIEELKIEYSAENLEDILDYQNIFNAYFEEHFVEYSEEAREAGIPGEIIIDEKQSKVEVLRSDMKKYLFEEIKPGDKVKPVLNYAKTMTEWAELGDGDMTIPEDFDTIELYQARIDALNERILELQEEE